MISAVFLGVEGVAGDEGSFELGGGVLPEGALGDGQFEVVLSAVQGALGERLAGGVEAEGDDAAQPALGSEVIAVQREGFGEEVAVFREPGVESAGEFNGVDAVDEVVEGAVAGHGEEADFFVAAGQAAVRRTRWSPTKAGWVISVSMAG